MVPKLVRAQRDFRAVVDAAAQPAIRHAEVLVVVAAKSGEPRDFRRSRRGPDTDALRKGNRFGS